MKFISLAPAILVLFLIMLPQDAHATQTVTSPYVTKGQAGVELKGGYKFDEDDGKDKKWQQKTEFFYNPTDFWQVKVGGNFQQKKDNSAETSSIHLENKFEFTEPGTYFIDTGLRLKYLYATNTGPDEVEVKLLMAKTIGPIDNIANLTVSREVGKDSSGHTEYGLSYSGAYKFTDTFKAGLEWYSDFGDFSDDFSDENHQLGPVAYGKLGGGFGYQAGVLFGVSDAAADATIKTVIDYKVQF